MRPAVLLCALAMLAGCGHSPQVAGHNLPEARKDVKRANEQIRTINEQLREALSRTTP